MPSVPIPARILMSLLLGVPSVASAWGGTGHRLINEYAVDNLPAAMWEDGSNNGFNAWRGFLREHASDPDLLRSSGRDSNESPRHFCDIDSRPTQYPAPFATVPRDYAAYVAAFGRDNGVVMWEGCDEHADGLRIALKTRNWAAAKQAAADLGHYVADSHSPLHGTVNYNGQLTGNNGIHSRHESEMVNRYFTSADMVTRRTNPPLGGSAEIVDDAVEFGFRMIVESQALVAPILASDTAARAIDSSYGTAYYARLYQDCGDFTLARLNTGARRLADLWYTAWVAAGQPNFASAPVAWPAPVLTPVVDGALDEFTGTPNLQTNTTEAGLDNVAELDQLFFAAGTDAVHLGIAGNLGAGYAVVVLLDTKAGGSATLGSAGPSYLTALAGSTLDSGLRPDYALLIERSASARTVRLVTLATNQTAQLGSSAAAAFPLTGGGAAGFNNTNTGGVKDRDGRTVGDCENVRTGIEVSLPRESLGIAAGAAADVRMLAFLVNTGAARPLTNQFLPGMPLGAFAPGGSGPHDFTDRGYARFAIEAAAPKGTGLVVR